MSMSGKGISKAFSFSKENRSTCTYTTDASLPPHKPYKIIPLCWKQHTHFIKWPSHKIAIINLASDHSTVHRVKDTGSILACCISDCSGCQLWRRPTSFLTLGQFYSNHQYFLSQRWFIPLNSYFKYLICNKSLHVQLWTLYFNTLCCHTPTPIWH